MISKWPFDTWIDSLLIFYSIPKWFWYLIHDTQWKVTFDTQWLQNDVLWPWYRTVILMWISSLRCLRYPATFVDTLDTLNIRKRQLSVTRMYLFIDLPHLLIGTHTHTHIYIHTFIWYLMIFNDNHDISWYSMYLMIFFATNWILFETNT